MTKVEQGRPLMSDPMILRNGEDIVNRAFETMYNLRCITVDTEEDHSLDKASIHWY